jgi:hypothetical protein|tara:strand:- start:250 stop:465 length:216 start_codon:yes stop_codon:yes gene_type:complete
MNNMKELSTYNGCDDYDDRNAKVLWCLNTKTYFVEMTENDFSEVRGMDIHNESYAEDCAENFVMGFGEFGK